MCDQCDPRTACSALLAERDAAAPIASLPWLARKRNGPGPGAREVPLKAGAPTGLTRVLPVHHIQEQHSAHSMLHHPGTPALL